VETIFDTLNAKAALFAIGEFLEYSVLDTPLFCLGYTSRSIGTERLSNVVECSVYVHANAGLPNAMGGYDETQKNMTKYNTVFFEKGWLNMVGG
jgi:5-methyltetrahydrofolate--homocysteine methyltransferase